MNRAPHSPLVKGNCTSVLIGLGSTGRRQAISAAAGLGFLEPSVSPWPSECQGNLPAWSTDNQQLDCLAFTVPFGPRDQKFVASLIQQRSPWVIVFDSHPLKPLTETLSEVLGNRWAVWHCDVNAASIGFPQSRLRRVFISGKGVVSDTSQMAMLHLLDAAFPQSISNCIDSKGVSRDCLEGTVKNTKIK